MANKEGLKNNHTSEQCKHDRKHFKDNSIMAQKKRSTLHLQIDKPEEKINQITKVFDKT